MTILAPRMRCALGLLVPLVLVAGCGDIARDCTTIGGDSGVTFEFSSVDELAAGPRLEVEGCVDSTCESWTVDTRDGTQVFVQVAGLDGETAVPVSLTVTTAAGRVVFDGETDAVLRKNQPNGAGCEPVLYDALVATSGPDVLEAQGP